MILDFSVALNSVLGVHHRPPYVRRRLIDVINFKAIRLTARRLIERFDIRPTDPDNQAGVLSGGNQQKLVVAREMDQAPKLLIAAQPTRGVDVGSIEAIHRRLIQARDAGLAVWSSRPTWTRSCPWPTGSRLSTKAGSSACWTTTKRTRRRWA